MLIPPRENIQNKNTRNGKLLNCDIIHVIIYFFWNQIYIADHALFIYLLLQWMPVCLII